jgi:uncharacterized protein (DUF427 family)
MASEQGAAETGGGRRPLEPGPEHPIAVSEFPGRVRVAFNGRLVANTANAVRLQEAGYPPVYYIPREDCDWSLFAPSDRTSHCPYKGEARYFHLDVDGRRASDAVWSYERPYPAVARIAGCVAFYPDRVDTIEAD